MADRGAEQAPQAPPGGYAPNHDAALLELGRASRYNAWIFDRASGKLGSRILDAGAGLGTFTELAAQHGDVVALEPHSEYAELLRTKFADAENVDVIEADLTDLVRLDIGTFDSAICFNVLEHIRDDGQALASMYDRLVPGGRLFLLVPAHAWLYSAYDSSVGHVCRYDRKLLGARLADAGFVTDDLRHVNPVGAAGWLLAVKLPRRTYLPSRSVQSYDRLVPALRWIDRLSLPVGLSLWAEARRPAV